MATEKAQPSFSPGRKWKIGLDLFARTMLVMAVVVMANYLAAQFPQRLYLSSQTRVSLSPRTVSVLKALTNNVTVTLYYDTKDDFYHDIAAMLMEYQKINPKISFTTVDYIRELGEAQKIKERYNLASSTDRNLIIFDAGNGRFKIAPGDALIKYAATGLTKDKKLDITPVAFNAEEMFTAILVSLESNHPFKAYYLRGHGAPALDGNNDNDYSEFASVLAQNFVSITPLDLAGDGDVPSDCDLLIIASPKLPLNDAEAQKISQYLSQGGRLFVLLDYYSLTKQTGLEPILQKWGVGIGQDYVLDKNSYSDQAVIVSQFGHHAIVDPLAANDLPIEMVLPRPVIALGNNSAPDAPEVTPLAFSSPASTLAIHSVLPPQSYPLIAAIEQKTIGGVPLPRGPARLVVTGDSIFLDNKCIRAVANRDFLGNAVNWLLDRQPLLEGIGPRPVTEFRLILTKAQQHEINWLLLGMLPGGMLLLGGLIWFVRRK